MENPRNQMQPQIDPSSANIVIEKERIGERVEGLTRRSGPSMLLLVPLVFLMVFVSCVFGINATLVRLEPHLSDDVTVRQPLNLWIPVVEFRPSKPTIVLGGEVSSPRNARRRPVPATQPENATGGNTESTPLQQSKRGGIRKQEAIPLLQEPERSGFGNDCELKEIFAEEAGLQDGMLLYKWRLTIENLKNKRLILDVRVALLDDEDNELAKSSRRRSTLGPRETRELDGEILVDPTQSDAIDSVKALVTTPF